MKIALAQTNPVIGDFEANQKAILGAIDEARVAGADLVVFPEMVINGYPPRDLLENNAFVRHGIRVRDELAKQTQGLYALVGYADFNESKFGRPLRNSAALLGDRQVLSVHHKSLLPTYDIFDEDRYFEPCESVVMANVGGHLIGVSICEDIWNEPEGQHQRRYRRDPVQEMADAGAELIVNLSCSPFEVSKTSRKYRMLQRRAVELSCPVVYVNQVGGNDDLVFEGGSIAFNAEGHSIGQAPFFEEGMVLFDTNEIGRNGWELPEDGAMIHQALVLGVRDYLRKCRFTKVVIGLSGGIDSAVTAAIAVDALGADNVIGISMPSCYSSEGSLSDAADLAANLGIALHSVPIAELQHTLEQSMANLFQGTVPDVTEENMQARLRGTILMAYSNKFGCLLLTTGNKSELAVGYCTLYGDMNGGLAVLSDLPKTEVYKLAQYLNRNRERIPLSSITKAPSAELRPDQTDQDSLPPYDLLDAILELYIEQHQSIDEISKNGFDKTLVTAIARRVDQNEYKRRQAAPGIKVTSKAFGTGRRIPIAKSLHH